MEAGGGGDVVRREPLSSLYPRLPPLVFFVSALYSICWCQPQLRAHLALLQRNCNEERITHNLLYIIMHSSNLLQ